MTLVRALVALVVLTLASWAAAGIDVGPAGVLIALGIAAIKATIVAFAFMEIRDAGTPALVIAGVVVAFVVLLAAGTVADVELR